jgi:hypothetical protein
MAGYSKRSLVDKLGIKRGASVLILEAPKGYAKRLGPLPEGVAVARAPRAGLDFIHLFTTKRTELERRFGTLHKTLAPAGMFWVSWPKKASGVPTDVTEDVVRGVALAKGLVDVKVCAVDDTWSGLKLVRRLKDR